METFKNGYEEGVACGKAKRECATRRLTKETHSTLSAQIKDYERYAQNVKSKWFKGFYTGIADHLKDSAVNETAPYPGFPDEPCPTCGGSTKEPHRRFPFCRTCNH